jgi:hypothetical protein
LVQKQGVNGPTRQGPDSSLRRPADAAKSRGITPLEE